MYVGGRQECRPYDENDLGGNLPKSENEEREERILDAAAQLITHYGYDKTTVSDIAQEAGVSKGAIYLHFDSKDALFEALLMREVRHYSLVWLERLEADPQGGTLASMYKNSLYALNSSPFMVAMFKQDSRVLGSYLRKPDNFYRRTGSGSMRATFLEMMQQAGAIRQDINPRVYAHIMNMLAYGLVGMEEVVNASEIPDIGEILEAIGDMLDRALAPESGSDSEKGKAIVRQMTDAMRQQLFPEETKET